MFCPKAFFFSRDSVGLHVCGEIGGHAILTIKFLVICGIRKEKQIKIISSNQFTATTL